MSSRLGLVESGSSHDGSGARSKALSRRAATEGVGSGMGIGAGSGVGSSSSYDGAWSRGVGGASVTDTYGRGFDPGALGGGWESKLGCEPGMSGELGDAARRFTAESRRRTSLTFRAGGMGPELERDLALAQGDFVPERGVSFTSRKVAAMDAIRSFCLQFRHKVAAR